MFRDTCSLLDYRYFQDLCLLYRKWLFHYIYCVHLSDYGGRGPPKNIRAWIKLTAACCHVRYVTLMDLKSHNWQLVLLSYNIILLKCKLKLANATTNSPWSLLVSKFNLIFFFFAGVSNLSFQLQKLKSWLK